MLNIGTYHLLGCKTQDNYIRAKAKLLEGLGFKGTLILNSDDKNIKKINLTGFKGKILYFGFNDQAIDRLASFRPVRQHLQFRNGINGCTIIDDTWNCTPASMESALKVLKARANSRKTVAVLGYMPQLGDAGFIEYSKTGEKVVETGVGTLIVIGDKAKEIGNTALQKGFDKNSVYFCQNATELYQVLYPFLDKDTLVLFKFP